MSKTDSRHGEQRESPTEETRTAGNGDHDLILTDKDDRPAAIVTVSPIGDHGIDVADGVARAIKNAYGDLVEER